MEDAQVRGELERTVGELRAVKSKLEEAATTQEQMKQQMDVRELETSAQVGHPHMYDAIHMCIMPSTVCAQIAEMMTMMCSFVWSGSNWPTQRLVHNNRQTRGQSWQEQFNSKADRCKSCPELNLDLVGT